MYAGLTFISRWVADGMDSLPFEDADVATAAFLPDAAELASMPDICITGAAVCADGLQQLPLEEVSLKISWKWQSTFIACVNMAGLVS